MDMLLDYRRLLVLVLSKFLVSLQMLHMDIVSIMVLNMIHMYENKNKILKDRYEN